MGKHRQVMCNICKEEYSNQSTLKRHVEEVHMLIKYPYDLCDYEVTQVVNL